ncbi:MAG: hypothetical protein H6Q05_37 [Acidobacteria bacterium]|jgi:hypothetical protein|nr:hypothetical protein [Acidobacteriota bacterium]
MRFKGTLILLLVCAGFGAFLYFYEVKGGEQRTKAKQEENVIWKVPAEDVQQLDLITAGQHVTASRSGDGQWKITAPRSLEADSDELNRLATSASDISRESVIDENASNLAQFGLDPPQTTVAVKTKDGQVREIRFGSNNPTGNSTYAAVKGSNRVLLVTSYVAGNFNKKLDDLRNHAILNFQQSEVQSLDIASEKGSVALAKENDRWWTHGKERWAADSSAVSSILGDLSTGRIKEFFEENPDDYADFGFNMPAADVRLTVGKDKAIKHLTVGLEQSRLVKKGQPKPKPAEKKAEETGSTLYIARDDSRPELFYVDKDFLDKLRKPPSELREKTLAFLTRWDIDSITITNARGTLNLAKEQGGSDWVVGEAKTKAKWDAVNEIFDALEKPVKGFVDAPGALSKYGLDKPVVHAVLKQGGAVKVDCIFGNEGKEGVFAQVQGEPYIKLADKESLSKLARAESDYIEPPPAPPETPATPKK